MIYKNTVLANCNFSFKLLQLRNELGDRPFYNRNVISMIRSCQVCSYLHKKSRNVNDENNTRYFKLPFIGQYSRITELKLWQLLKRFCETDLNVKLVFSSFKIKNMFSFKDRTPDALKSDLMWHI